MRSAFLIMALGGMLFLLAGCPAINGLGGGSGGQQDDKEEKRDDREDDESRRPALHSVPVCQWETGHFDVV